MLICASRKPMRKPLRRRLRRQGQMKGLLSPGNAQRSTKAKPQSLNSKSNGYGKHCNGVN